MNRNDFGVFIKKVFGGTYNQGRQEWRFQNGDRTYTMKVFYKADTSTFTSNAYHVQLFERQTGTITDAAQRRLRVTGSVSYFMIGNFQKDDLTCEDLRNWIIEALVTYEFT